MSDTNDRPQSTTVDVARPCKNMPDTTPKMESDPKKTILLNLHRLWFVVFGVAVTVENNTIQTILGWMLIIISILCVHLTNQTVLVIWTITNIAGGLVWCVETSNMAKLSMSAFLLLYVSAFWLLAFKNCSVEKRKLVSAVTECQIFD